MKVPQSERALLGAFEQVEQAEAAQLQLRESGFAEVQLDRVGAFGYDPGPQQARIGFGGQTSQAQATLFDAPALLDGDRRVLLSAMPEASGMAGQPEQILPPYLVTVVAPTERAEAARTIIERNGGRV